MTDHADLTARLREHADRVAGGGPSDPNYDPETLSLEHEAADLIDSMSGEVARLTAAVSTLADATDLACRERDEALAEVAQLRAALFDVTHAVMQEAEAHRYGQPAYDMTLDHLYEIADHHRSVLAVSEEATDGK